jgi:hypothetical protein
MRSIQVINPGVGVCMKDRIADKPLGTPFIDKFAP